MVVLERDRINLIFKIVPFSQNVKLRNACTAIVALGVSIHFEPPEVPANTLFDIRLPSFGAACAARTADPQYRRQINSLHDQGRRPVGEFLAELGFEHGIKAEIDAKLSRYAQVPDLALDVTGARQFPPMPIHQVCWSQR